MYNRENFLDGFENSEPTAFSEAARELGDAIKSLADKSIRIEASPEQLKAWAASLNNVAEQMQSFEQRDAKEINRRLFKGEASLQDVFDIFDYDPATGFANPNSPAIQFVEYGELIKAKVNCPRQYQGPPNRVHGGTIAAIFDGLLSRVQQVNADNGVTGTISVRFHGATPINEELQLKGWVDRVEGRKTFLKAEMLFNDEITASAEGVWISTKAR